MSGMTGGSSNHSSSTSAKTVFNITHETDALQLLRAIHLSPLPVETKNKLRDAIFTYRTQPAVTDMSLLQTLFAEYNFEIVAASEADSTESVQRTPSSPFGFRRRQPQFAATTTTTTVSAKPDSGKAPTTASESPSESTSSPADNSHATESAPAAEPVMHFAPQSVTDTPVSNVPEPEPVAEYVSAQPSPNTPPSDVHAVPIKKVSTPPAASEAPATSQEPTTISTKEVSAPATAPAREQSAEVNTNTDAQQRIKDIKHAINLKVGNPITLIDIDNAVGKEYMAALLDAMKHTSVDPNSASSERAMSRLENAYEQAEAVVARQKDSSKSEQEQSGIQSEAAPAAPAAATATSQLEDEPSVSETTPAHVRATQVPAEPSTSSEPTVKEAAPAPDDPVTVPEKATLEVPTPPQSTATQPPTPNSGLTAVAPVSAMAEADDSTTVPPATPTPKPNVTAPATAGSISSPADDKKMSTIIKEQEAKFNTKKPEQNNEPLQSEDVTHGLEQLLSEWNIFKRSGMFGTGPNGIEHPLYESLAHTTMSSVLTGRFEGVTPEVKRSINDYMNGWRYEEGIVHESNETFEHYLRRVVHHILQKRSKEVDGAQ